MKKNRSVGLYQDKWGRPIKVLLKLAWPSCIELGEFVFAKSYRCSYRYEHGLLTVNFEGFSVYNNRTCLNGFSDLMRRIFEYDNIQLLIKKWTFDIWKAFLTPHHIQKVYTFSPCLGNGEGNFFGKNRLARDWEGCFLWHCQTSWAFRRASDCADRELAQFTVKVKIVRNVTVHQICCPAWLQNGRS